MNTNAQSPWQRQQQFVAKIKKERPELLKTTRPFRDEEVLPQIGITALPTNRPEGYIKLIPQDFIVEEVQLDESVSSVAPRDGLPEPIPSQRTLCADLVKVGISSLDAIDRLICKFNLPATRIGFAGIKDPLAFTSQRVSITRTRAENVPDLKGEHFFLTNMSYGQGKILRGQLLGNRFTVLVRTATPVDPGWLKKRLLTLKEKGFLNYYHAQRFGSERLSTHILGKLMLQGQYQAAVKHYLTYVSPYDNNLAGTVRKQASENYGNWQEMKRIMEHLPYTFSQELQILDYFMREGENYVGALLVIQEITRLAIYAYASLLFNKYLSQSVTNRKPLPKFLPLLTSDDPGDRALYKEWLDEDQIGNIARNIKPFRFISLQKRLLPTKIFAVNALALPVSDGVILHFYLPKGAYATTYIMNMFRLWQGYPLPAWIKKTEYDTLKLLGIGSIAPAKERLKDYVYLPLDKLQQIEMV